MLVLSDEQFTECILLNSIAVIYYIDRSAWIEKVSFLFFALICSPYAIDERLCVQFSF